MTDTYAHRTRIRALGADPLFAVMNSCARSHAALPGRRELTESIREALGGDQADEADVRRALKAAAQLAQKYNDDPRAFDRGAVYDAVEEVRDAQRQGDRLIAAPAPVRDDRDYDEVAEEVAYRTRGGHDWQQEKADRLERERLRRLGVGRAG